LSQEVTNLEIELLIEAVYNRFQYDFRLYSRSSLRRRLEQAMIRFHCKSVSEIQSKLLHEKDFFPKLIAYLTVNTTELFRDPTYFLSLRKNVMEVLKTYPSIKIWVAGCSTGEEVYSLAILLRECGLKRYLIYATDINPMNLEAAKKGIYSLETVQKGSRNYLQSGGHHSLSDYYTAAYDSVQLIPSLLENVVFSDHSLATDSVFSEVHFISCRNVLIYFDRELQDRVFKLFKDSLIRNGFLGLGSKETLQFSAVNEQFKALDAENRLYQKSVL
jgi:chemotaxis protein methyltransferase CheR